MKVKRARLADQVSDAILSKIRTGVYTPGSKIPNEFALAEELNVGRGSIREAICALVMNNILVIKRGNGTYVSEHPGKVADPLGFLFDSDKARLANDICEMRLLLEPNIAALAAERATEEEIRAVCSHCDEVTAAIHRQENFGALDVRFHEAIAAASHNLVAERVTSVIQEGVPLFYELTNRALAESTVRTHTRISQCISRRDSEGAFSAMQEHLKANRIYF